MSLNDRYAEAAFALRKGTPIPDTPEMRAALVTLFEAQADGWSDTSDFRPVLTQITDAGKALGHDWWGDRESHINPASEISHLGAITTATLMNALGLVSNFEDTDLLHRLSRRDGYGLCEDGLWRTYADSAEVRDAHDEERDTTQTVRYWAARKKVFPHHDEREYQKAHPTASRP